MTAKISGGCACGAIRYETGADPMLMLNCHCRDCQRASGGPYAAVVVVPVAALRLHGVPRYHRIVGNTGKAVERGFCTNCGTPVAVKLERLPDAIGVLAGSLDDPASHKPSMDIFTASAQAWDLMLPETKKLPQGIPGERVPGRSSSMKRPR